MLLKVHHWFGRAISLLGLAQIPLGLTLYGSPKVLFILYALVASALLLVYFWLSHLQERRSDNDHDSRYNYGSGSVVEDRPRRSSIGGLLKAAAVGLGVAALLNRHRNRSQSRASHSEAVDSRRRSRHSGSRHSGSYIDDEKYSHGGQEDQARDGWKDKLLQVGVIAAAYSLVSRLMNRKRDRDQYSEASDYDPPPDRDTRISSSNVDRIEEGRPLPSRQHPLNQPSSHRRSHSSLSYPEYMSASGERRQGHGLRDAVAGLGAFGLARNIFKNRRDRKEQRRLEAQRQRDVENERRARANNQRYTGDGFPHRGSRRGSVTTSTDFSASTEDRPRYDAGIPPPVPAGAFPAGATSTTVAGQGRSRDRLHNNLPPPNPSVPALPPTDPVSMPPIPPDPRGLFHTESSGSEAYVSTGGRTHRRRSGRGAPAPTAEIVAGAAAGAAAGVAAGAAVSNDHERHQSTSGRGSVTSPPVSIKIRMHNDGRNVTLRRLPEEEALAERRRRRSRHGRRHKGSVSSLSDMNAGGKHFRRTEALERQETDAPRKESENLAAARTQEPPLQNVPVSSTAAFHPLPPPQTVPGPPPPPQNIPGPPPPPQKVPLASPPQNIPLPPPPPVPGSSQGPKPGTSGSSPGAYDLSGTEASADYASNRRRRRAERAQGKLLRDARTGSKVEFS